MNKLTLSEKIANGAVFTAGTIAHIAIAVFATRTALVYSVSAMNRAKHVITTNGKIWNDSPHNHFIRTEK